jgi:hypothetical protein
MDGVYAIERIEKEWKYEVKRDIISRQVINLNLAQQLVAGKAEEQVEKIRGFIQPKDVKVGSLKQALDNVIEGSSFLQDFFHLTKWSFVKTLGIDSLKKAEDLMKKVLKEDVQKIKEIRTKERKEKENKKKKEDFEKLNNNWMKIQAKFRALGHPEWMPNEEEENKKKKKGIIGIIRGWWKKWRR